LKQELIAVGAVYHSQDNLKASLKQHVGNFSRAFIDQRKAKELTKQAMYISHTRFETPGSDRNVKLVSIH